MLSRHVWYIVHMDISYRCFLASPGRGLFASRPFRVCLVFSWLRRGGDPPKVLGRQAVEWTRAGTLETYLPQARRLKFRGRLHRYIPQCTTTKVDHVESRVGLQFWSWLRPGRFGWVPPSSESAAAMGCCCAGPLRQNQRKMHLLSLLYCTCTK